MTSDFYNQLSDLSLLRRAWHLARNDSRTDFMFDPYRFADFAFRLDDHLKEIARSLKSGTYHPKPVPGGKETTYRLVGNLPPEIWNRLGTKILPKLRAGKNLQIGINFSVTVESSAAKTFESDISRILEDLGLTDKVRLE